MRNIVAVGLVVTLGGMPSVASAQDILADAERLAAEIELQQSGDGVQRSMVRTLTGVSLIAGGAMLVVMPKSCRLEGALSPDVEGFRYPAGSRGFFQAENAVVTKEAGNCMLDYDVGAFFTGGFYVSPITKQKASEVGDGFDTELAAVRGTAEAYRYTPSGALYGGIGLIAAGALLATFWSDTPVANSLTFTTLRGRRIARRVVRVLVIRARVRLERTRAR